MLEFRKPATEELPELKQLLQDVAADMAARGETPGAGLAPEDGYIFKDGGRTAGIIFFTMPQDLPENLEAKKPQDRYGLIRWMAIHPAYGRQGLGTAMLQIAEGLFMDAGALNTRLTVPEDNGAMGAFLAKNGYTWAPDGGARRYEKRWVSHCPGA